MNKAKSFKPFPTYTNEKIEQAYQKYILRKDEMTPSLMNSSFTQSFGSQSSLTSAQFSYKTISLDDEDAVDFERMVLYAGKKEVPIERQFAPSLYINYFGSPSQTNLQLMIHKLQIDNQLYDSVFPVVFSKVLPPKSITCTSNFSKFI